MKSWSEWFTNRAGDRRHEAKRPAGFTVTQDRVKRYMESCAQQPDRPDQTSHI